MMRFAAAFIVCITLVTSALHPAEALAQSEFQIDQVLIEGNRNVDAAAVKQQLKHQSGRVTADMISEDVQNLYKSEFFDQVSATIVQSAENPPKTSIKYSVVEKPQVRKVFIRGNKKADEDDLAKYLDFGARRFLDKGKVEGLMRTAVAYYQSLGYYDASIEYSVVPVGDGQVDVTFTVSEGGKVKIREISIKGLSEVDEEDLLSAMQTKRYKWWSSWLFSTGRLNTEMLENDRNLARQWFVDHGYLDGSIGAPAVDRREDGVWISFEARDGRRYKLGNLKASGDLVEGSEDKTLEGLEATTGEYFSAATIRQDSFKISDKLADQGYAFVNVVPNTEVNRDGGIVDINFAIDKGKLVSINRVNIRGNTKTYDNVIRRELDLNELDRYSGGKIKRAQELLQRLGYFEEVSVNTEPVGDDKVDVNVNVREGATGQFSVGAGYSSGEGMLFNTRVTERNLFGTGRSADINFDIGTERNNLVFSLNDRRFNDSYVSLGVDIYRYEREYNDFDRELLGAGLTAGYPMERVFGEWAQDINGSIRYEFMDIDISNVDPLQAAQLVIDSEGRSTASTFTPRLVRSTLNNPMDPTRGSVQDLAVELAGAGGDERYYLLQGKQTWYYPLFPMGNGEVVFSWRTRVDYGETFGDDIFPLFQRFFPGGINSVRGYKTRSLGPRDENGHKYGGSKDLVNNFDLIVPLLSSAGFKGVVFYDAGEAFDDDQAIALDDLRQAWGAGIRWSSPVGPMRLEFGFPIDRRDNEKSMVTQFSFGAPF